MHILVTGATGRVGSRIVTCLIESGHQVRALVRHPEHAEALRQQGAELIKGNLIQGEILEKAVADIEAIVHLAAFFRGANPEEANAVNLDGTLALAHAGLTAGISRFIFASTTLVYGAGHDRTVDETTNTHATSPYPLSKIEAEEALLELQKTERLGLCILRLAFVYGDNDPHLADGMEWFRNWHPQRRFQLVHHADVAQAIMLILSTQEIVEQIYNVADDEPVTIQELLQAIGEQPHATTLEYPVNDHDDPFSIIVSTDKIRNQLGFRSLYSSLQEAIKQKAL